MYCKQVKVEDIGTDEQKTEECTKKCREVADAYNQASLKDELKKVEFAPSVVTGLNIIQQCKASQKFAKEIEQKTNAVIPKLEVEIPGVVFSPPKRSGYILQFAYLSDYISGVYKYLLAISAIIAIVMIMIGGLEWLVGGPVGKLDKAKKRIKNAVIGLLLLFGTVMIVSVVNPQLLTLGTLNLEEIKEKDFNDHGEEGEVCEKPPKDAPVTCVAAERDCSCYTNILKCAADCAAALPPEKKSKQGSSLATPKMGAYDLGILDCFTVLGGKKRNLTSITHIGIHEGEASSGTLVTWAKKGVAFCRVKKGETEGTITPIPPPGKFVSSHYIIAKSGVIYQITDEAFTTRHGIVNGKSIGIDLDGRGSICLNKATGADEACDKTKQKAKQQVVESCSSAGGNPKACGYSDAQYTSLRALIKDISARTSVTINDSHILGHCQMTNARLDPRNLDWERLGLGLTNAGHRTKNCKFVGPPGSPGWGTPP